MITAFLTFNLCLALQHCFCTSCSLFPSFSLSLFEYCGTIIGIIVLYDFDIVTFLIHSISPRLSQQVSLSLFFKKKKMTATLLIRFTIKLFFSFLFLEPALFLIYDLLNVPSPAAPLPPLMNPNVVFVITASPYELRARPLKTAAAGLTRSGDGH